MGFRTIAEVSESIKSLLSDKPNFKKNKKLLHDLCLSIVAIRRREFFSKEGVDFTSWNADKEYVNVKKEFLGKNMKLVPTSKEIANKIDKKFGNGTSKGFSVIDKMTEKAKRDADKHIAISPVFVGGTESARKSAEEYSPEENSEDTVNDTQIVVIEGRRGDRAVAIADKPKCVKTVNRLGVCKKCKK